MTKEQKGNKPKEEKDELVGLTDDKKKERNYNEEAKNVIEIIEKSPEKEQFNEFAEFLGSFLELGITKFGDETVLNHLENIKFDYRLTRRLYQLGVLKKEWIKTPSELYLILY